MILSIRNKTQKQNKIHHWDMMCELNYINHDRINLIKNTNLLNVPLK